MTARPRSDIEVQLIIKRWPAEVGQLQQRYRRREKHAIQSKKKCKRMSCFSEDMIITYYGLSKIISRLQESKQQMSKQAVFQFWLTVSVMWSITQQTGTLSVLLFVYREDRVTEFKKRWLQLLRCRTGGDRSWITVSKLQPDDRLNSKPSQQSQAAAGSWKIPCKKTWLQHPQGLASRSKHVSTTAQTETQTSVKQQ